jgi:hypothetical protein
VRSGAKRIVGGALGLAVAGLLAIPGAAFAGVGDVPGEADLLAGTFTMVTPSALSFSTTLNGTNQVLSQTQALEMLDQTGSGAGWNVTLTSTQFATTAPVKLLSLTAASDMSLTLGACDALVSCTLGTNTTTYPIVVPAATVAPTAVKIQTAAIGTGLAGQTWTHTMDLAIPANTKVGSYLSTWTYSLVSAP